MIKQFLEDLKDFKEPGWEDLSPSERGNVAATIEKGTNKIGSKFYRKNEGLEANYRNYLAHKIFEYINKIAGKTVIPIAKHFEFEIIEKKIRDKIHHSPQFISSSYTDPAQIADLIYWTKDKDPKKYNKGKMLDKYINNKFNIPLKILGTWDLHEGNRIVNMKKISAYGIDFGNEQFKKNSYKGSGLNFSGLRSQLVKGKKDFAEAYYRYAQTLFFWNNILDQNKSNFRKVFDDVKKEISQEIDKKIKKTIYYDRNELWHATLNREDKENYSAFIKNVVLTIRDTGRELKKIEDQMEKENDKKNT